MAAVARALRCLGQAMGRRCALIGSCGRRYSAKASTTITSPSTVRRSDWPVAAPPASSPSGRKLRAQVSGGRSMTRSPSQPAPVDQDVPAPDQYSASNSLFAARAADARTRTLSCSSSSAQPAGPGTSVLLPMRRSPGRPGESRSLRSR